MRSGIGASGGHYLKGQDLRGDVRFIEALERGAHTSYAEIARDCGVFIDTIPSATGRC
jgi:hypothetical protein